MEDRTIMDHEIHWKEELRTLQFGYNSNYGGHNI